MSNTNITLMKMLGTPWGTVRFFIIDGQEMHVACDICKIVEVKNVSQAVKGVSDYEYVTPSHRVKKYIAEINGRRKVHLLNLDGVFELILNNKSTECRRIKAYLASQVLPYSRDKISYH